MRDEIRGNYLLVLDTLTEKISNVQLTDSNSQDYNQPIVYEVLRIHHGKPVFLKEHLNRFNLSLKAENRGFDIGFKKIEKTIRELIDLNDFPTGNVKIVSEPGNQLIFVYFIPHNYPTATLYLSGVKLASLQLERSKPNVKLQSQQYKDKIALILKDPGYYEVLLTDHEGFVTEGSRSNFFAIKNNVVFTPPDDVVLKGITREKIIEICSNEKINLEKKQISYSSLGKYDAAFISGTSPKVLPVLSVDEKYFFDVDNSLMKKLMMLYDEVFENG